MLTGATVLQHQQALPTEFRITRPAAPTCSAFPARSWVRRTPRLTVCRSTPVGNEERVVTISGTGSAYVTITTAGTCS